MVLCKHKTEDCSKSCGFVIKKEHSFELTFVSSTAKMSVCIVIVQKKYASSADFYSFKKTNICISTKGNARSNGSIIKNHRPAVLHSLFMPKLQVHEKFVGLFCCVNCWEHVTDFRTLFIKSTLLLYYIPLTAFYTKNRQKLQKSISISNLCNTFGFLFPCILSFIFCRT